MFMEITSNIFQLKIPIPDNPLGFLNAYLVKTDEGCMLIDSGWNTEEAFNSLAHQIEEAGIGWGDIRYIFITHTHPDHFGLVGRLVQYTTAKIMMHEMELSIVQQCNVDFDKLVNEMGHWLRINGVPNASRPVLQRASLSRLGYVSIAQPDVVLYGGEHLKIGYFDFEVLWTPGHSQGHICLFERSHRLFFSGDHVLPNITPNVSMHVQSIGNPLADYLNGLNYVAELPIDLVLPAHGDVFSDLKKRIKEIRQHHVKRNREIMDILEGGSKTAYQVSSMLSWSTGGVAWNDLRDFTQRMAVTETVSHLELLFTKGFLQKISQEGVIYYILDSSE